MPPELCYSGSLIKFVIGTLVGNAIEVNHFGSLHTVGVILGSKINGPWTLGCYQAGRRSTCVCRVIEKPRNIYPICDIYSYSLVWMPQKILSTQK